MAAHTFSAHEIERATEAALECLAWSTSGLSADGEILESLDGFEFSPIARALIHQCIDAFMSDDGVTRVFHLLSLYGVEYTPEMIGHDYILDVNGHGTGFWDRDYRPRPKAALDYLSSAARENGSLDAYLGDDGMVWV